MSTKSTDDVRKEGLDRFYTIPSVAQHCIDVLGSQFTWNEWDLVVEPSAGNGSFSLRLPALTVRYAMDLSPEDPSIALQDFFTYTPPSSAKNVLVIGNPPFGRISSLAIKFFQHAAQWANVIAFILPRTFRRVSVQNRLPLHFHLEHDEDIPLEPCSFSPPMKAKCCFQIWRRREVARPLIPLSTEHADWDFVPWGAKDEHGQPTPPLATQVDFALRAYGGECGAIRDDNLGDLRPKSWHWIKSNIDKAVLMERFRSLDYSLSQDTARQNSIGRWELVRLYSEAFD
jgi:hypothetical protein